MDNQLSESIFYCSNANAVNIIVETKCVTSEHLGRSLLLATTPFVRFRRESWRQAVLVLLHANIVEALATFDSHCFDVNLGPLHRLVYNIIGLYLHNILSDTVYI